MMKCLLSPLPLTFRCSVYCLHVAAEKTYRIQARALTRAGKRNCRKTEKIKFGLESQKFVPWERKMTTRGDDFVYLLEFPVCFLELVRKNGRIFQWTSYLRELQVKYSWQQLSSTPSSLVLNVEMPFIRKNSSMRSPNDADFGCLDAGLNPSFLLNLCKNTVAWLERSNVHVGICAWLVMSY